MAPCNKRMFLYDPARHRSYPVNSDEARRAGFMDCPDNHVSLYTTGHCTPVNSAAYKQAHLHRTNTGSTFVRQGDQWNEACTQNAGNLRCCTNPNTVPSPETGACIKIGGPSFQEQDLHVRAVDNGVRYIAPRASDGWNNTPYPSYFTGTYAPSSVEAMYTRINSAAGPNYQADGTNTLLLPPARRRKSGRRSRRGSRRKSAGRRKSGKSRRATPKSTPKATPKPVPTPAWTSAPIQAPMSALEGPDDWSAGEGGLPADLQDVVPFQNIIDAPLPTESIPPTFFKGVTNESNLYKLGKAICFYLLKQQQDENMRLASDVANNDQFLKPIFLPIIQYLKHRNINAERDVTGIAYNVASMIAKEAKLSEEDKQEFYQGWIMARELAKRPVRALPEPEAYKENVEAQQRSNVFSTVLNRQPEPAVATYAALERLQFEPAVSGERLPAMDPYAAVGRLQQLNMQRPDMQRPDAAMFAALPEPAERAGPLALMPAERMPAETLALMPAEAGPLALMEPAGPLALTEPAGQLALMPAERAEPLAQEPLFSYTKVPALLDSINAAIQSKSDILWNNAKNLAIGYPTLQRVINFIDKSRAGLKGLEALQPLFDARGQEILAEFLNKQAARGPTFDPNYPCRNYDDHPRLCEKQEACKWNGVDKCFNRADLADLEGMFRRTTPRASRRL